MRISYDGNRLKNINELVISSNIYSQKEYLGNSRGNEKFRYDANGNMTTDLDRDIVTIRYNLLNLPELIQFRNGSQILNSYDAAGTKFESRFITCLVTTVVPLGDVSNIVYGIGINRIYKENKTYYCGNYEYIWDSVDGIVSRPPVLSKIHNSEGYKDGQDIKNDILHYYRRDHLGNVREVWKSGSPAQTVQRMQYYPSGLPWADCMGADYQNRKYNGKEFIEMHGYDCLDYHARHMFPALMRFTTIDPLAEKYYSISPYVYCANNPVLFIDPDGKDIFIVHENERYKYSNGNVYKNTEGSWEQVQAQEGSYLATIQESLNTLASEYDGKLLVGFFTGDKNHIQIKQRKDGEEGSGNRLSGWSVVTDKKPEGSVIPTEKGLQKSPLFVAIGHEMAHRKDIINGTFDGNEWFKTDDGSIIPNAEKYATHYENKIRAEHGLPLRTHYARDTKKGVGPEIIQGGQSVFYNHYGRPFDYRYRVTRRAFILTL